MEPGDAATMSLGAISGLCADAAPRPVSEIVITEISSAIARRAIRGLRRRCRRRISQAALRDRPMRSEDNRREGSSPIYETGNLEGRTSRGCDFPHTLTPA